MCRVGRVGRVDPVFLFVFFHCFFFVIRQSRPAMDMEVPAAATSDTPLPPQWEELYDEAEGKPYFYNNKTDESSWDRPE